MTYSDPPYHPRKRRSICQYLADESREMGMRVYMDVALSKWYSQILPYYQRVQKRNTEMKHTKFLCFEQLTQSNQTEELFLESMDWFFPGGHTYNTTPMAVQDMESTYKVAHATNSPSSVKHRLRNLVQHLDEKIFHGTYSAMDKALGCGMNGDRRSSRWFDNGFLTLNSLFQTFIYRMYQLFDAQFQHTFFGIDYNACSRVVIFSATSAFLYDLELNHFDLLWCWEKRLLVETWDETSKAEGQMQSPWKEIFYFGESYNRGQEKWKF